MVVNKDSFMVVNIYDELPSIRLIFCLMIRVHVNLKLQDNWMKNNGCLQIIMSSLTTLSESVPYQ